MRFPGSSSAFLTVIVFFTVLQVQASSPKIAQCHEYAAEIRAKSNESALVSESEIPAQISNFSVSFSFNDRPVSVELGLNEEGPIKRVVRLRNNSVAIMLDSGAHIMENLDGELLGEPVRVERLFRAGCTFSQRVLSECSLNAPHYSKELQALFIDGETMFGRKEIRVLGISTGSKADVLPNPMTYIGDVAGQGHVVLRDEETFKLFDGVQILDCFP